MPTADELAAELVVARTGCVRCHAIEAPECAHLQPLVGPALVDLARWYGNDGGATFLRRHHGGEHALDLAAWLQAVAIDEPALQSASTSQAGIARGEQLFGEFACGACHAADALALLADRTDHAHLTAFLTDPAAHRPGVAHDFGLVPAEASALAAWLLRRQWREDDAPPVPGFAFECFEVPIKTAGEPDLNGVEPVARGVVETLDVAARTRDNQFALRFTAQLDVPEGGQWKFTTGSDDSSWLWIDGEMVVRNEGLAPHRRRSGTVQLEAGSHALQVLYTEGGGNQSLEVLWQGPGTKEQPIPGERARATAPALAPPAPLPPPDEAAVERGRAAAIARRCVACHASEDAVPAATDAAPPRPWQQLQGGACPADARAAALFPLVQSSLAKARGPATQLAFALQRDGCLNCHRRGERGGLPPAVSQHLVELEDLGEEGRQPPDLTEVGRRLRREWIAKVIGEGHLVRPYLRVRMPKLSPEVGEQYADWFAAVDRAPATDVEPPFTPEAVELGAAQVGLTGRNCISCHTYAGLPSSGPQGMDLSIQFERLRPSWFKHWLLRSVEIRPGTRMPQFWPLATEADKREIDAIRSWLSLGAAAPVPAGMSPSKGSLLLLPTERAILHGAFLDGVSARCIAVGTKERTHYAFDVEHGRLAWLWRGDFLDAAGTWSGRAGQCLKPKGSDWIVLDDFLVGGDGDRTVRGHRIDDEGLPVFHLQVGAAEFEDASRARLTAAGTELVRTLHGLRGEVVVEWRADVAATNLTILVDGQPAPATSTLSAGETLEVTYRW